MKGALPSRAMALSDPVRPKFSARAIITGVAPSISDTGMPWITS